MQTLKPRVPIDVLTIEIIRLLHAACNDIGVRWVIVGATARIIILEHVLGLQPARATRDVDFAVAVEDWETFEELKRKLVITGHFAVSTSKEHRLYYSQAEPPYEGGIAVDLVPFGGVEDPKFIISWPREADTHLNVIGCADVLAGAMVVEFDQDTHVPIASLPGQALLKIIAWHDRRAETDAKDARDLLILLRAYVDSQDADRVYSLKPATCEDLDWDRELMGAYLMGSDAIQLASIETQGQVRMVLSDRGRHQQLVEDMSAGMPGRDDAVSHAEKLLDAFEGGFAP